MHLDLSISPIAHVISLQFLKDLDTHNFASFTAVYAIRPSQYFSLADAPWEFYQGAVSPLFEHFSKKSGMGKRWGPRGFCFWRKALWKKMESMRNFWQRGADTFNLF